ncbi:hypothetical protein GCM10010234_30430 [Streptomyces hawaiiensis]|uniref:DUF899 family protein n=1 Tax=Streptomyces hawaiiensis TaxID=67305 RepID=UPI0031E2B629
MTTTPDSSTAALPGRPPVVDPATWQTARDELLVREKAHTREGDAIAATRRRLMMVEFDGTVEVVGPDGPATTGRGNERVNGPLGLLDMTPYGRGEAWEDNPGGWPEGRDACWSWRPDAEGNATWGPTSHPAPQWTRPGTTPVETLGRRGRHH